MRTQTLLVLISCAVLLLGAHGAYAQGEAGEAINVPTDAGTSFFSTEASVLFNTFVNGLWYQGDNSEGAAPAVPEPACEPNAAPVTLSNGAKRIFLTCGSIWTVPSDWNNTNNSIEVIGAGGGGDVYVYFWNGTMGSGGGGGAYSSINNVTLASNTSISYRVGAGGAPSSAGGNTYLCNTSSNCDALSSSAVIVGAQGGRGGAFRAGGPGGSAQSGKGALKTSGGAGYGAAPTWTTDHLGGAGGAGGAHGDGVDAVGSISGAGDAGHGGAGGQPACPSTPGGTGTEWDASHGSGGGAGAGTACSHGGIAYDGAVGGRYGGGGGSAGDNSYVSAVPGRGAQGIIVITYANPVAPQINRPPVPATVSSSACTTGESVTFNITATDPDGDNVKYGVDWDNNGSIDQYVPATGTVPSGTTMTASHTYATGGQKSIGVFVIDEHGTTAEEITTSVVAGQDSTLSRKFTSSGSFVVPDYKTLTVTVIGAGGQGGGSGAALSGGGESSGNNWSQGAAGGTSRFASVVAEGGGPGANGGNGWCNVEQCYNGPQGAEGDPGPASGGDSNIRGGGAAGGVGDAGYVWVTGNEQPGWANGGPGGTGGSGGRAVKTFAQGALTPGTTVPVTVGVGAGGGGNGSVSISWTVGTTQTITNTTTVATTTSAQSGSNIYTFTCTTPLVCPFPQIVVEGACACPAGQALNPVTNQCTPILPTCSDGSFAPSGNLALCVLPAQCSDGSLAPGGNPANCIFDFSLTVDDISSSSSITAAAAAASQPATVKKLITATLLTGSGQPVVFSATGVPTGVDTTFSKTTCTPTCFSVLTLLVGSNAPPGTYQITVKGEGGSVHKQVTFPLTIGASCADGTAAPNGDALQCPVPHCADGTLAPNGDTAQCSTPHCPDGFPLTAGGTCTRTSCPAGYQLINNLCWNTASCPTGFALNQDLQCEALVCSPAQHIAGNACVCDDSRMIAEGSQCVLDPNPQCTALNTHPSVNGGACICNTGYVLQGTACVFAGCPAGYVRQVNQCAFTACPTNFTETFDVEGTKQCVEAACTETSFCIGGDLYHRTLQGTSCTSTFVQRCGSGCFEHACLGPPGAQLTIGANPILVRQNDISFISWSSVSATSCTVIGTNGDAWTGITGGFSSKALLGQTSYTLACVGSDGVMISKSVTVNIIPSFIEQ